MGNAEITRTPKIWLGEDGIVRVIWSSGVDVTLEDAEECMAAYLKINKGIRCPLLVDAKGINSFAREARQYFASDEAANVASAVALIVDNPVSKVLSNFYLGLSNPRLPTRLFSSEKDALEWLKGFLE